MYPPRQRPSLSRCATTASFGPLPQAPRSGREPRGTAEKDRATGHALAGVPITHHVADFQSSTKVRQGPRAAATERAAH